MLGLIDSGFIVPALEKKIFVSGRGKISYSPFFLHNNTIFYAFNNNQYNVFSDKVVQKDDGSSKTSIEVKKPTGLK
jgi:hypothetical protein